MSDVQIRWLLRRDLDTVRNIDFECYANYWTEADFLEVMRQRNVVGMVAELRGDVVGFMVYELHKSKLVVPRFAVHPNWQRQGVGREMVVRLWDKLSTQRRRQLEFYVSERSLNAHLFLKSLDFFAASIERNYCGRDHDAYRFVYELQDVPTLPKWAARVH